MKTTTMTPANDTFNVHPTKGAGRDVWKAIGTMEKAVLDGNFKTARKASVYAFPRLGIAIKAPESDSAEVWALVLRTVKARAETLDAEAMRWRRAFVG